MEIIAFYTQKGGTGKTTLALNLAGYLNHIGKKVVVIGVTCYEISLNQQLPFEVLSKKPDSAPDADVVIFDWPSGESMPPYRIVVVPTQPTILSWQPATQSINTLERSGTKVFPVINMLDVQRELHVDFISQYPFPCVKNRSIYEKCMQDGYTVFDDRIPDANETKDAREEIKKLWEAISIIHTKTQPTHREISGSGQVSVYRRNRLQGKDKLVHLSHTTRAMLDERVVGSHVQAIDELVRYALDQLKKHDKNLEII